VAAFFFNAKPQRTNLVERWPATPEDNLERLANAGFPYDRQIPKCSNCGGKSRFSYFSLRTVRLTLEPKEMGHGSKACKQERIATHEKVEVKCVLCQAVGHRARDCTEPRVNKFACRNCGLVSFRHRQDDFFMVLSERLPGARITKQPTAPSPEPHRMLSVADVKKVSYFQPCRPLLTISVGHFAKDCPKGSDMRGPKTCRNCG
jgi:hypothetical protein